MKRTQFPVLATLFLLALTMSSCELAGDIFKAGAWTGIIGLILGVALVIWLISRLFGRSRNG